LTDSNFPQPALPATAEAVVTFLDSVGRRSEAELYLRLFRQLPLESFALIAVETAPLATHGASLAEQLRFLADLGLLAPVVVGLFDPELARAAADRFSRRLGSVRLDTSIYSAHAPGLADSIRTDLRSGVIPILTYDDLAENTVNRFHRLGDLAAELASRKIVVVRQHGALGSNLDRDAELAAPYPLLMSRNGISVINLRAEFDLLRQRQLLIDDDLSLLEDVQAVYERVTAPSLVFNVTGPFDVLKELFTVKGAGTVVRRGTPVAKVQSYADLDQKRLRNLIESSFGRVLKPDQFSRPLLAAYIAPEYHGAALLEPSPIASILSKFVVDPVAQGEGMGRDIWQAMVLEQPSVIWRARSKNPICSWYAWQCDGMVRRGYWTVYWRGVEPDRVPQVVELMLSRPDDFER
jgi:bifunctional N-acetylglutamate synthase/kinase